MKKVELSLQERRRGRKRPSLMVKKDGMILNKVMNDIVDIRKPLDILKNALLDSCPGNHLDVLEKWFVNLDQRLLVAQTDITNIAYLKNECAKEINEVIHSRRDVREISNIVSVYSFAINELKKLSGVGFENLAPDWATAFYDSAKDSSDEEIQVLWGKFLAGEIAHHGKFYKRTLSILKNMESIEAKHFVELVPLLIAKETVPVFIFQNNEFFQYNDLQTLMDCGIVNSSEGTSTYKTLGDMKISGFNLVALNNDVNEISIDSFSLTDAGLQLCQLIDCNHANENYVKQLAERLSRSQGKVIGYKKFE